MADAVLVTGGSGYIGLWLVKKLLEKGYRVRATVRNKQNEAKVQPLLDLAEGTKGKIELYEADLLKKGSFDEAAEGCTTIFHVASPFTLRFKDAQKDLIEPALEGTRNVLGAASASKTVKKVVLTSSVAAVHGDSVDMQEQNLSEFTEEHWNTTSSVNHQPYSYSKVVAEKAASKIAENQKQWQLIVINPSFVLGPSLTGASDSESIQFMKDMTGGKFAMGAPMLMFGFVDVRDVAEAHILAAENEKAEGRHILAERTESILNLAKLIDEIYPGRFKLPKMQSPKFLLYFVGWMFGLKAGFIKRNVGYEIALNTTKSREKLGLKYTPLKDTLKDMIDQMQRS